MKLKILLTLFLTLPICSNSQVYTDSINNNELKFKQVYEVDLKKDEIRKLVNKWIAVNFKDANTVIKLDNEDNTILKGMFIASAPMGGFLLEKVIDYTLDFSYKENKYKVEFYDLTIYSKGREEFKSPVDSNTESFEHYNSIRPESTLEENQLNHKKALKYRESINFQIKTYLTDISESLNLYINKNINTKDW